MSRRDTHQWVVDAKGFAVSYLFFLAQPSSLPLHRRGCPGSRKSDLEGEVLPWAGRFFVAAGSCDRHPGRRDPGGQWRG